MTKDGLTKKELQEIIVKVNKWYREERDSILKEKSMKNTLLKFEKEQMRKRR